MGVGITHYIVTYLLDLDAIRAYTKDHGSFSTALIHLSPILKQSVKNANKDGMIRIALLLISCILKPLG